MKSLEEIKDILKQHEEKIKKDFYVKEIGIFGSYLHNEQKDDSDIDILVEFEKVPGFIRFMELEEYISNLLNTKVDLVMKSSLKPHIGQRILNEVNYF